ncbi:MAG TPA: helicase HerA-like domain-containing protein [Anaerolineales bacterium]|nr:helicase HerA-like domain-containing protein [Anaerolineales bacterium]
MTDANFYLGRAYDPLTKTVTNESVYYNAADLTTHAVVTGMTGSGKTGLCITLLEEAALAGVPAIIIDPKGDLTNLLLHFPDLAPQDFQPWIDPEMARRAGKTLDQLAVDASTSWRQGLQEWGITPEQILALKNAAQYAIYTPGSDAGIPVSVLSSLTVPALAWQENRETLREKISSTVTALLGLVGYDDIDPLRSREHILLANIFENAWSQGKDIELTELILQTQRPPFEKLGAFPVDTFFPAKDRMELAMVLNNILAAPAFETWREGQSLDINTLLFTEDGRPRHSIFYLAHLSDAERMFFVTLLLSAVESWMRTQSGASSLRALLYMDEMFGYLPPQRNPPSKQPLLRMLKSARAFGLGLLLATQNPVDVDYKALSNAGTWFIGKLQTEQDKNRLLDGLESASGGVQRGVFDKLISSLGKRVFILHNIHAAEPKLFQTRWAMNFLAGPLTRAQIPALNQLVGAKTGMPLVDLSDTQPHKPLASTVVTGSVAEQEGATVLATAPLPRAAPPKTNIDGSITKPPIPAWIKEYYLPQNYSLPEAFSAAGVTMPAEVMMEGAVYRPALLASARVRILDRKLGVDSEIVRTSLVSSPEKRGSIRWEDFLYNGPSLENVDTTSIPSARFGTIDTPLNDTKLMTALQKDFTDWVYRTTSVKARANQALKVYAGPDVSQAEFMKACAEAAREARDSEIAKKIATIDRQIKTVEDKLAREERELREDESELSNRKIEEAGTHLENLTGLFGGRRKASRLSSSLTKRRMTEQAKADVEESVNAIDEFKRQLADLQRRREETITEINDRWGQVVGATSEVTVAPKKTDVFVTLFGVAWLPYYIIRTNTGTMELPAFGVQ